MCRVEMGGIRRVGSASKLEEGLSGAKKFLAAPVARADHPLGPRIVKEGALWCECFFVASLLGERDVPDNAPSAPNREKLVVRMLKTFSKQHCSSSHKDGRPPRI